MDGGWVDEYWNIAFNCDQSKLIVGGTRCNLPIETNARGMIFDINTSDGSVNSMQEVGKYKAYSVFGMPQNVPNEVRSITSSYNARYYYLTLDSIGAIDENIGTCSASSSIFRIPHTYSFGYKCENFRPDNGNAGINAIRANQNFVYTANGTNIHKRSLATGAILTAAAIPGGGSSTIALTTPTANMVHNSGLEIDDCGNVYTGSANAVIKFNANLGVLSTYSTLYRVYDVTVTNGGNVIACGATGDNSSASRTGYVEYITTLASCNPLALQCCNANICPPPAVCSSDAAFNMTASLPGGTWSGAGITDATNGTFDPATAGPGTHWVSYTAACGTDSIAVQVNSCAAINVCQETNGDVTVSSGTPPYNWYSGTMTEDCSQCMIPLLCQPAMANCPLYTISWTLIGTGSTITPTGDTLMVVDGSSNSDTIYSIASLPVCGACPDFNPMVSNLVHATCNGSADGSFGATVSAGTAPFDFILQLGGTTVTSSIGIGTSEIFSGLGAGNYTLIINDNDNCTDTVFVTITEPAAVVVSITGTLTFCEGTSTTLDAGTGYTSYQWSDSQATQTIDVTTGGTYSVTVTDGSGCPGTDDVIAVATSAADATITSTGPICVLDGPVNLTATDPGGTWTGTGITDANAGTFNPSVGVGTYSITYTIAGACGDADVATIEVVSIFDPTIVPAGPFCSNEDTIHLTAANAGGAWSVGGVSNSGVFDPFLIGAGNHEVIYTIPGSCGGADTTQILVHQAQSVTAATTGVSCKEAVDGTIFLSINNGTAPYTINWTSGEHTIDLDSLMSGTYNVTVVDSFGCTVSKSFIVPASDSSCYDPAIYVPNIFSPNGDGTNDVLYVRGRGIESMEFIIYDRWGEKVFNTRDQMQGWDGKFRGKPMESGVFVYYLKAKLTNEEDIKWKGNITIVR